MNKQWIQQASDLLHVGKVQGSFKRNPDSSEMHWAILNIIPILFRLKYAVSTIRCQSSNIQQLGSVDEMIVFSAGNINVLYIDLEAKAALIFPESRSNARFHAWRSYLASSVEKLLCLSVALLGSRLKRSIDMLLSFRDLLLFPHCFLFG